MDNPLNNLDTLQYFAEKGDFDNELFMDAMFFHAEALKRAETAEARVKRLEDTITRTQELIERWGGIDGDHHKLWLLDQVMRVIQGDNYKQWVIDLCAGEDGPNTYDYDEGIAP